MHFRDFVFCKRCSLYDLILNGITRILTYIMLIKCLLKFCEKRLHGSEAKLSDCKTEGLCCACETGCCCFICAASTAEVVEVKLLHLQVTHCPILRNVTESTHCDRAVGQKNVKQAKIKIFLLF